MKPITRLGTFFSIAFFLVFLSCQKENTPGPTNPVKIYLTDHQTPIFDSVFVDLVKLEVKLDSLPGDGWTEVAIRSGVYNILRYRNGLHTLFGTGTLPGTGIKKLRLTLGTQNSVMKDNQSFPLDIKDNERQVVLNISPGHYDLAAGQVVLWLDFDAGNSIKAKNNGPGNNTGYELKPHINAFAKNKTGRIEGMVLPHAADPIVKAIIGSDTATAIPERTGEFKIVGLRAGNYKVLIDGQNNYKDSLINNVVVTSGQDTKLPSITLQK